MKTRSRQLALCVLGAATLALRAFGANRIEPVSAVDPSLPQGLAATGDSLGSTISPDGAFVVFASSAKDLVPAEAQAGTALDLFLRNRTNGLVTLISANADGTGGGNGNSAYATFTPDGRYVAFESEASDLVTNDANQVSDIFVRDIPNGKTILVSVNTAGTASGNNASSSAVITPDGRYVVFVSAASDLVADDTNGIPDVFVRDLQFETTTLVSVGARATYVGWSRSDSPVISTNGRLVAFTSTATNLVAGATNWQGEVYVRDLAARATMWASSNATAVFDAATGGASSGAPSSSAPVLSDDGRFLAFKTFTTYLPAGATRSVTTFFILRQDLQTGTVDLVATNATGNTVGFPDASGPVMTPDGSLIAYAGALTSNSTSDVYLWDAPGGTTTLVSVALDGSSGADGLSDTPALTPHGYVTFVSDAGNLVTNTAGGQFRVYRRDLQAGVTTLVTVDATGQSTGGAEAAIPTPSADGRFVAFDSDGAGFVLGDDNNASDDFVRDLVAERTELVSSRDTSRTGVTGNGFSSVSANSLSADGRYVVFVSSASDLVAIDTNGFPDVFVRDLQTATNLLVSVANDGTQANSSSHDPVISADGRSVAFLSSATNLAGEITNRVDNVYVRNLVAGTTTLVSVGTNGVTGGSLASSSPSMSVDGSRLAFLSSAANLAPGHPKGLNRAEAYVRDLRIGVTYPLSTNPPLSMSSPVISPDGRWVAFRDSPVGLPANALLIEDLSDGTFTVVATNFDAPAFSGDGRILAARYQTATASPDQLLLYDLVQQTNTVVAFPPGFGATPPGSRGLSVSYDGRFVAFTDRSPIVAPDTNNTLDVFIYDALTAANTLVSSRYDGTRTGNGSSFAPSLSADGRFVVYRSYASDLVVGDTNDQKDVFLYDRLSGRHTLISRNRAGTAGGNDRSSSPVISANGRVVAFESLAEDLVAGDLNQTQDVFVYHVAAAPQVEIFGPSASGAITLRWDASPGETYQVQSKADLQATTWDVDSGDVTIAGSKASWVESNTAAASQRFYRVVVVE